MYRAQNKCGQAEPLYLAGVRAHLAKLGAPPHRDPARQERPRRRSLGIRGLFEEGGAALRGGGWTPRRSASGPITRTHSSAKNGLAVVYKGDEALRRGRGAASWKYVEAGTAKLGADAPTPSPARTIWPSGTRPRTGMTLPSRSSARWSTGSRRKLGPTHPDTQQRIRNPILCYGRSTHLPEPQSYAGSWNRCLKVSPSANADSNAPFPPTRRVAPTSGLRSSRPCPVRTGIRSVIRRARFSVFAFALAPFSGPPPFAGAGWSGWGVGVAGPPGCEGRGRAPWPARPRGSAVGRASSG